MKNPKKEDHDDDFLEDLVVESDPKKPKKPKNLLESETGRFRDKS